MHQVSDANFVVKDSSGNQLEAQYVEVDDVTTNLRKLYVKAYLGLSLKKAPKYWLLFQVSIPPLGWSTYFISEAAGKSKFQLFQVSVSCFYHSGHIKYKTWIFIN